MLSLKYYIHYPWLLNCKHILHLTTTCDTPFKSLKRLFRITCYNLGPSVFFFTLDLYVDNCFLRSMSLVCCWDVFTVTFFVACPTFFMLKTWLSTSPWRVQVNCFIYLTSNNTEKKAKDLFQKLFDLAHRRQPPLIHERYIFVEY